MVIFKQIILYLMGIGLLLFGFRRNIDDAIQDYRKKHPKDENKDLEKHFETQVLKVDTTTHELRNDQVYFQVLRISSDDLKRKKSTRSKITTETDHAETATDSM
ncbi:hypothetical protein ACSBL2_05560 [Pedobacter sp. AW31-3R]|uniref:hypothetical protein n=1 Tax=Pedobacter sp. AW31-3R TaxID=3445781 RepID=UPI003FA04251